MSSFSEKVAAQKRGAIFKVPDLKEGEELTHTVAFLVEDEVVFGEKRDVLYFENTDKRLVLNLTNSETLIALLGDDPTTWPGQPVALFLAPYGREGKLGIRIKTPATQGDAPKPTDTSRAPGNGTRQIAARSRSMTKSRFDGPSSWPMCSRRLPKNSGR